MSDWNKDMSASGDFLDSLFNLSPIAMMLADLETGRQVLVNEAFLALAGHNGNPLDLRDILPVETSDRLMASLRNGRDVQCSELFLPNQPDREFRATMRMIEHQGQQLVLAAFDVQHIEARERLSRMAFKDSLTGLPNRSFFLDELNNSVHLSSGSNGNRFAVMLLDLDRFKMVNDSLGHLFGDSLLIDISRRLESRLCGKGALARVGGDEFGVLLNGFEKSGEVLRLAREMLFSLENPLDLGGSDIQISASMGIVLFTGGYTSAQELLRDAGIALHEAKSMGAGRFKVFNRRMHHKALETMRMQSEMRRTLKKESFLLSYQPIVRLDDLKLMGLEVLLRWNHPQLGIISPTQFLGDAEETGMIVPIGEWVLREACTEFRRWCEAGLGCSELFLNVNVSCRQLFHRRFLQVIREILKETGMPPESLKLELTEHALLRDCLRSREVLMQLKDIGVGLVIDDFGTGYSSLSYLRRFPFDQLKVDRSFISGQGVLKRNIAIVQAILAMAKALHLGVVAEGIEDEEQATLMNILDCPYGQGYFFSRPLESDEIQSLLKKKTDFTGH